MSLDTIHEYKALIETLKEKNRLASLRADICEAFTDHRELETVLHACTEALVKNLNAAFARIWVLDKAGEVLELRASSGIYTHLDGPHGRVKVGDFKIGRIAQNLKAHISNSVPSDPEVSDPAWAKREGMISFAGYPLVLEGRALGVVAFFSRETLSPEVLGELEPIADGIAQWIKRKQAETALAEAGELLKVTLSSIGDAVVATDVKGRVTFLNPVAEVLTGWTTREAIGKALEEVFIIVQEETRHTVENPVVKVLRENRIVGLANHTLLIAKDGSECPIEDSAAPICDAKGTILGVVLVFRDATETRRGETAMRIRAEELEQKVVERTLTLQKTVSDLEAFSHTVSHDLRSPLRAMQGYSSALLEDYAAELPENALDYLRRISLAAERLDRLIRDLLFFSRLTDELNQMVPIDLNRLLGEILQQYPDFHEDKADISVLGSLPFVLGHESALTQVVANLIGNGIKFVPEGRKAKMVIRADSSGNFVRLWFEDNGIGIAGENQGRIFKIFEQINSPGLYPGTGVGLALVKKSVEKMQGNVGVDSAEGKGARFWVDLIKADGA
jgi:PAS domain S-box-containing protein